MPPKGERTKQRIIEAAITLFSEQGVHATSVRQIARSIGMNEASLYNHFSGKRDLYDHVVRRFEERLLRDGFAPDPVIGVDTTRSVADVVLDDAARFFQHARNRESLQIWRILMMEQYRDTKTAEFVRDGILRAPERHIERLLARLQELQLVRTDVDLSVVAHSLAALFFYYSFEGNLNAWLEEQPRPPLERLNAAIRLVCSAIENR